MRNRKWYHFKKGLKIAEKMVPFQKRAEIHQQKMVPFQKKAKNRQQKMVPFRKMPKIVNKISHKTAKFN